MKLYFEIGLHQGMSVDVKPPGISFGRETDNDVQLEEEKVSRYHAKLTQDGGIWYIEDLGSSNGTSVNGRTLTARAPVSLGDRIGIGSRTLVFMEDGQAPASAATATDGAAAPAGGDGSAAAPKRKSLMVPLAVVLVLALLAVVGGIVMNQPKTTGSGSTPALADTGPKPLRVHYERFQASQDTVFRYVLDVQDGELTVVMDDLYDGLHVEKQQVLTEDELENLEKFLVQDEFLSMASPRPVVDSRKETRVTLAVASGNRGNVVELVNTAVPPHAFSMLETYLRGFVFDTLKLVDGSRKERLALANTQFELAHQLWMSKTVKASNLFDAVHAYEYVLLLLEGMDDPPDFYKQALSERHAAAAELETTLTDLRNRGALHIQAGNLQDARIAYQDILSMVPETSHEANREARQKIQYIQFKQDQK